MLNSYSNKLFIEYYNLFIHHLDIKRKQIKNKRSRTNTDVFLNIIPEIMLVEIEKKNVILIRAETNYLIYFILGVIFPLIFFLTWKLLTKTQYFFLHFSHSLLILYKESVRWSYHDHDDDDSLINKIAP